MVLIASGPVGWVVGCVLAAVGFCLGKEKVENFFEWALHDKKLPPMLKKTAKSRMATELKLYGPQFEEQVYAALRDQCGPLYEALDKLSE